MKNIKLAVAAVILGSLSFGSMAADLVSSAPDNQQKIGVISATGSTNLASLESQLSGPTGGREIFPHHFDLWSEQPAWHSHHL